MFLGIFLCWLHNNIILYYLIRNPFDRLTLYIVCVFFLVISLGRSGFPYSFVFGLSLERPILGDNLNLIIKPALFTWKVLRFSWRVVLFTENCCTFHEKWCFLLCFSVLFTEKWHFSPHFSWKAFHWKVLDFSWKVMLFSEKH